MTKKEMIAIFGGVKKAADALGIERQTVWLWPDRLTDIQEFRVLQAKKRLGIRVRKPRRKNGDAR